MSRNYRVAFKALSSDECDILAAALPSLPSGGGELSFAPSEVDGTDRLFLIEGDRSVQTFVFADDYATTGKWVYENECNVCSQSFHAGRYSERCDDCETASIEQFETYNTTINKANLAS
jgi:hypothetical protein